MESSLMRTRYSARSFAATALPSMMRAVRSTRLRLLLHELRAWMPDGQRLLHRLALVHARVPRDGLRRILLVHDVGVTHRHADQHREHRDVGERELVAHHPGAEHSLFD